MRFLSGLGARFIHADLIYIYAMFSQDHIGTLVNTFTPQCDALV